MPTQQQYWQIAQALRDSGAPTRVVERLAECFASQDKKFPFGDFVRRSTLPLALAKPLAAQRTPDGILRCNEKGKKTFMLWNSPEALGL